VNNCLDKFVVPLSTKIEFKATNCPEGSNTGKKPDLRTDSARSTLGISATESGKQVSRSLKYEFISVEVPSCSVALSKIICILTDFSCYS